MKLRKFLEKSSKFLSFKNQKVLTEFQKFNFFAFETQKKDKSWKSWKIIKFWNSVKDYVEMLKI